MLLKGELVSNISLYFPFILCYLLSITITITKELVKGDYQRIRGRGGRDFEKCILAISSENWVAAVPGESMGSETQKR